MPYEVMGADMLQARTGLANHGNIVHKDAHKFWQGTSTKRKSHQDACKILLDYIRNCRKVFGKCLGLSEAMCYGYAHAQQEFRLFPA